MIDASQVSRFASKLHRSPNPIVEQGWKSEWSAKIADEWRANAAVDTGEYRDSIHVTEDGAEADAEHGVFVERGTSDTAPQPALVPAINRLSRRSATDAGDRVILELT